MGLYQSAVQRRTGPCWRPGPERLPGLLREFAADEATASGRDSMTGGKTKTCPLADRFGALKSSLLFRFSNQPGGFVFRRSPFNRRFPRSSYSSRLRSDF